MSKTAKTIKNPKGAGRIKGSKYTTKERTAALELLRANNENYSRTVSQLDKRGITLNRQTLFNWRNSEVGAEVFKDVKKIADVELTVEEVKSEIFDFVNSAGKALNSAILEMEKRITNGDLKNHELASYAEVLNAIANPKTQDSSTINHPSGALALALNVQNNYAAVLPSNC